LNVPAPSLRSRLLAELPGIVLVLAAAGAITTSVVGGLVAGPPAGPGPQHRAAEIVRTATKESPRAVHVEAVTLAMMVAGVGLWAYSGVKLLHAAFMRRFPDLLPLNWRADLYPAGDFFGERALRWAPSAPWGFWGVAQAAAAFVLLALFMPGLMTGLVLPEGSGLAAALALQAGTRLLWLVWVGAFLYRRYGVGPGELLGRGGRRGRVGGDFATGVSGYLRAFPLVTLAALVMSQVRESWGLPGQKHALILTLAESDLFVRALAAALAVAVAAVVEELLFRRLLYAALRRRMGFWRAAVVSSALFAAVHMNVWEMLPLFILGMMLALVYERRRSLCAPVVLHAVNNGFSIAVILLLLD
jgi:membrane protease YdiL (CAAX protease family)